MNRILSLVAMVSMCGLLAAPSAALADAVPVANNSFQDPALNPGGWSDAYPNWQEDVEDTNGSFVEHIGGFNAGDGDVNHLGINALETTINAGIVPAGTTEYSVWQDLGVPFQPNTIYTLTVAVGNRNTSFTVPGNVSAYLLEGSLAGPIDAGVFDASTIPGGTFADAAPIVFTTGDDTSGLGNIVIRLVNAGPGRAHFDNVRLDAAPIPEPSTVALAAMGAVAIGGLTWRRRRRSAV